jgi:signal peptide peptidase SppA
MITPVRYTPRGGTTLAIAPEAIDVCYAPYASQTEITCVGGIAIVTVSGPLNHHEGAFFDSFDAILKRLRNAIERDDARAVIMCFDSPGGDAAGMIEAHRAIRRMRKMSGKAIYAYANETIASAAYGLACACDEIWGPATSVIGSVGVLSLLEDRTKENERAGIRVELVTSGEHKADRRPDRKLTPEIIDRVQQQVDHFATAFWRVVAKARGMSVNAVSGLEASVFFGQQAVDVKLADGVAGWDDFFALVQDVHGTAENHVSATNKQAGSPLRSQEMRLMSAQLKLKQEQKSLLAKLASATTDEERLSLSASLSTLSAKMVKHEKVTERYQEEGGEEEGEEEDEDEDEESSKAGEDEDEDEGEDEDDDEDDDEEEEEEESAKALLQHQGRKAKALLASAKRLTGQKSVNGILGALDAIGVRLSAAAKTEERVKKLEVQSRREKVDALIKAAKRDGRVSPSMAASLAAAGMKDPRWLKGHLAQLPKLVRSDKESIAPALNASGAPDLDSQIAALAGGSVASTDQERILKSALAGMSADEQKAFSARLPKALSAANEKFNSGLKGPKF